MSSLPLGICCNRRESLSSVSLQSLSTRHGFLGFFSKVHSPQSSMLVHLTTAGTLTLAVQLALLEASIEGARGILLNIAGGSDLGLFEVNEAAEIIHGVAHPDANIIFGAVIDDNMGDEVRVTVIAAGFERWEDGGGRPAAGDRTPSLF